MIPIDAIRLSRPHTTDKTTLKSQPTIENSEEILFQLHQSNERECISLYTLNNSLTWKTSLNMGCLDYQSV